MMNNRKLFFMSFNVFMKYRIISNRIHAMQDLDDHILCQV